MLCFFRPLFIMRKNYQKLNTKDVPDSYDFFPGKEFFQAGNEWIAKIVDDYIFC